MKIKQIVLSLFGILILISCSKEKVVTDKNTPQTSEVDQFENIVAHSDFKWSSSKTFNVSIQLNTSNADAGLHGDLWIVNEMGERLDRKRLRNSSATFTLKIPANHSYLYAYYPLTGERIKIQSEGILNFEVGKTKKKSSSFKSPGTSAITEFIMDGDLNNITPTVKNYHPFGPTLDNFQNAWYTYNLAGWNIIDQGNGDKAFQGTSSGIWQTMKIEPGEDYTLSFGEINSLGFGVDVWFFNGSYDVWVNDITLTYDSNTKSNTFTAPDNARLAVVIVQFNTGNPLFDDISMTADISSNSGIPGVGSQLLVNNSFSSSVLFSDDNITAVNTDALNYDGGWWCEASDYPNWSLGNYPHFFTGSGSSSLIQVVKAQPNSSYRLDIIAPHLSGTYVFINILDNQGNILKTYGQLYGYFAPQGQSGPTTENISTPANAAYMQVRIPFLANNYMLGGLKLTVTGTDSDGDGISDSNDDFPNDAGLAYASYFPTTGYQTLAFEDLWPYKGDYDFNDVITSTKVTYAADASNKPVSAIFEITLDAAGSGIANGIGVELLRSFPFAIIESVTGDAIKDPSVLNGIIVTNDIFQSQGSGYYANNGDGPSGSPITFSFRVNYTTNYIDNFFNVSLDPDVYIFRTNNRAHEIHRVHYSGTSVSNMDSVQAIGDDTPNGGSNLGSNPYMTNDNIPWVLEVITPSKSFHHPLEKIDIISAYPQLVNWAQSNGVSNKDWWQNGDNTKVYIAP